MLNQKLLLWTFCIDRGFACEWLVGVNLLQLHSETSSIILPAGPIRSAFKLAPTAISAVTALTDFLNVRGQQPGPLFCSVLQKPLPRYTFDSQLRRCLNVCDLDTSLYKGHSFRIGAATYRTAKGVSDAKIRTLGRW